jgi:hypothetical protein
MSNKENMWSELTEKDYSIIWKALFNFSAEHYHINEDEVAYKASRLSDKFKAYSNDTTK